MAEFTVLIVGGYGIFGGRLVDLLADEPRLKLIVGGRSLEKARAFSARRKAAAAELVPARIDRNGNVGSPNGNRTSLSMPRGRFRPTATTLIAW